VYVNRLHAAGPDPDPSISIPSFGLFIYHRLCSSQHILHHFLYFYESLQIFQNKTYYHLTMSYGESYGQGREQYGQGQRREEYGDQQYRGNYGANAPDFSDVVSHAENHGGSSSSYFNEAANYLQQQHGNISNQDIDQEHMVNSHQKFYGGGGGDAPASSNELGAGAAMQALKAFTSGGSGGGGGQNQLIGLAMAEAEKLFDQQSANGNAVSSIWGWLGFGRTSLLIYLVTER
jgi:hypothetical protein